MTGSDRQPVNGWPAIATLTYLGFALLLVQVGIVPLLPIMGRELRLTAGTTSWILTISLLSGAIALALLTRLADLHGKRPMVLVSLLLVLAGSVVGSLTSSLPLILAGRVLMGAQLPMLALPEALASDTMPRERARLAISTIHAGTGLGVAAGLLMGAAVGVNPSAYHVYFIASAVAVAIGLVATLLFVHDTQARARGGLDLPGAALLALALASLLLGLSQGPTWGWGSWQVVLLIVAGVALFGLWFLQERRARHPLISVDDLTKPGVRVPYLLTFAIAVGVFGGLSAITRLAVTPPRLAGFGFGDTSLQVGLYAIPVAIGTILGAILCQQLSRRRGQVITVTCSFSVAVIAYCGMAVFHQTQALVMASLGLFAVAAASGVAVTQIMIVRAVPAEESAIALGLSVVIYAVSTSVGSVVVGVLFASITLPNRLPALGSYLWTFAVYALIAFCGLVLSVRLLVGQRRRRTMEDWEAGMATT